MNDLSRPPAFLPLEDEFPPILFRVTSAMTFGALDEDPPFASAHHLTIGHRDDTLADLFTTKQEFAEVATLHLTTQHKTASNSPFKTCFVSVTSSFRYAVAISEQHLLHSIKRGLPNIVAITVIDTTLLSNKGPIWDAQKLSNSLRIRLYGKQNSAKDEYIIFRQVGTGPGFRRIEYTRIRESLRSFVPEVLDQLEHNKRRFSETWEGLEPKPNPDNTEARAAFDLAAQLSAPSYRLRLPLMVQLLCINPRKSWGGPFKSAVTQLVSTELESNDPRGMEDMYTVVCVTYQAVQPGAPRRPVPIFDFTNDFTGRGDNPTCTIEVRYSYQCLAELGPYLQSRQANNIESLWNLSVVGVLVRKFAKMKGVPKKVDDAIKSRDREDWAALKTLMEDDINIAELATAYIVLRDIIEEQLTWPLARLYKLLEEVPIEHASSVASWTDMLRQLSRQLVVDRPNKRKLESSEAEAPATKKPRVILPLKKKQGSSVASQVFAPASIAQTITPTVAPSLNPTINVSHGLQSVMSAPILYAATVPTIHDPGREPRATGTTDEERLIAHHAEPHQAPDDKRATCVTMEQDGEQSTVAHDASEPRMEPTRSVPQASLRDEPGTEVDFVPMDVVPTADSDREVTFPEGYASSDSTAVETGSEEADVITSRMFLAGSENDRETGAPEVNASLDSAAIKMSSEEADVTTSTTFLSVLEPVASSEPEELRFVPETKPVLAGLPSHDRVSISHDDFSNNDEPLIIVSQQLAHLAVPGAVIAAPEHLEDIIEVLPLSSEEEENSA